MLALVDIFPQITAEESVGKFDFFFHSDFMYGSQTSEIIYIPKLDHNEVRILRLH